jgi:sporulation protein YlmC with PRC-barrel domain
MNYEQRDQYGIYKSPSKTVAGPDSRHGPGPRLMGAETLIGNDVCNKEGVELGEIKEIMLDVASGRVSYAVLSFGGFLGMGEKLFAVPWGALHLDTGNRRFVLDVAKDQLKDAPGFDRNHWPDMADATWVKSISDFYGEGFGRGRSRAS